jgi:site-specific recombinase XerD
MSPRNIQKIIKKYAAKATETDNSLPSVHPHLLRRSRASNLYQNGVPIEIVSRFLGHASAETTKNHYAYPSLEQMRTALNSGKAEMANQEKPLWEGHEDELAKLCGLR